ncbi:hypothetical protein L7F22_024678 [Adiantum nelumboides]|nr:hypothetical protein [Adiantum nelumboides]
MNSSSNKEEYFIRKFDGTNFTIWKERMKDVLTNKGLLEPLKERAEDDDYTQTQWDLLDAKAMAMIRLHLAKSVFFTIIGKTIAKDLWDSLCLAWESKSASNKVFVMKKLMKLSMKEGSTVSGHLNEFNSLFSQLTPHGFSEFDDELKSIFLLCSQPSSWDIFCTAISNSAPNGNLVFNDVTNALLIEEIRRNFLEGPSLGDAYMASSSQKQRGRDKYKNKSKSRE